MKRIAQFVIACSISTALAVPAIAHHSAAAFDTQKEVKLTGTVKVYTFKNPHVYMTVEVSKADGSKNLVEVEAGAASVLNPLGFNKDSVKVGEVVTITGNPGRNNPDKLMLGKDLVKSDGTYYPLNIASRSIYAGKNDVATSIAGTWHSPRTEFTRFLGGARGWAVTDKGRAAMTNVDPKATTQKDCVPIGAPALMFYPVATTITVQRDRVVLDVDWMDSERIVYLDGRKPPANQTSLHGFSVGRWEDKTLVVETVNFREHPMGLSTSLPSSTQKRLIERFSLSPDGKALIYSGSVEDPVYLAKPIEWTGRWEYRPGMPHSNQKCDVDVARRFLLD
ncbi:MAG TPA: DUF6152 family protein [Terriglobia bacterium]|nr:DUF6152 family protein [Terriglobia bacterium]